MYSQLSLDDVCITTYYGDTNIVLQVEEVPVYNVTILQEFEAYEVLFQVFSLTSTDVTYTVISSYDLVISEYSIKSVHFLSY